VTPLAAILILLLLAAVILVIAAPLRGGDADSTGGVDADGQPLADTARGRTPPGAETGLARDQLEAAREAKYREIRDSELDYRTGKLSQEDYAAIDTQLRAEALDILNRLERLEGRVGEDPGQPRADAPDA
jgi:hypothetical protein